MCSGLKMVAIATEAYRSARTDPAFQAQFEDLLVNYAGVPSLLYPARRLSEALTFSLEELRYEYPDETR